MRKTTLLVTALALVLGLTQCKKEQTSNTQSEGNGVMITLNVDGGDSGSRVEVNPPHVTFEDGDQILVASNDAVVGTLNRENGIFSGEITDPTEGQRLYFYFLGNKQGTVANGTTELTVNISDQTTAAGLPVISMGESTVNYSTNVTNYTSRLYNKCSLMKFNVTTPSTAAICITGMNNKVTVHFDNPTNSGFEYGMNTTDGGLITMPAKDENNVTWAIVLPQNALAEGAAGSLYTADNAYTGTRPEMAAIEMNKFLNTGVALEVNTAAVPEGAINGKFTINGDGDQVYFSKGNLQYIGSATTPYWKFADNQWKYLGTTTGQNSQYQTVDRDLFGWGTSGYNHGAMCYQPWNTYPIDGRYNPYNSTITNLYDGNGQADWGYNAISNGGNTVNSGWRTLTQPEWDYVINTRNTRSGDRYAKATVDNVNGVILLPDNWTTSTYTLSNTNTSTAGYDSNDITAEAWTNTLEANGAVFLPAAGNRTGSSVGTGSNGYWSASYYDSGIAYILFFDSDNLYTSNTNTPITHRRYGLSVRLVRPAE